MKKVEYDAIVVGSGAGGALVFDYEKILLENKLKKLGIN